MVTMMLDIDVLVIGLACFAGALAYVFACDRL
jgi:hypothetical protein